MKVTSCKKLLVPWLFKQCILKLFSVMSFVGNHGQRPSKNHAETQSVATKLVKSYVHRMSVATRFLSCVCHFPLPVYFHCYPICFPLLLACRPPTEEQSPLNPRVTFPVVRPTISMDSCIHAFFLYQGVCHQVGLEPIASEVQGARRTHSNNSSVDLV